MDNVPQLLLVQQSLLKWAEQLNYQVLVGEQWLGGHLGVCWDATRRSDFNQRMLGEPLWGMCEFSERVIWIHPAAAIEQRTALLVHELAHALLHHEGPYDTDLQEAEAEAVCGMISEALSIPLNSGACFSAEEISPAQLPAIELRASQAADQILVGISGSF